MAPDLEERAERLGLWMPRQDLQDVSLYPWLFDNPLPAGERSQDTDGFISRFLGNRYVRSLVAPVTTGSLAFLLSCGDMRSPASYQTQNYGTEQVSQKKIETEKGAIIYDEQLGNAVFRGKNGSYSLFQNEKPQPDIGRLLQDEDSRASKPTLLGEQPSIPGVDIESEEFWAGLAPLTGDFDNNKIVQFKDFLGFVANYQTSNPMYDLNKNGIVDFADFLMFVSQYGIAQMQDTIESKAFIDGTIELSHRSYGQPNGTFLRFRGNNNKDFAVRVEDLASAKFSSAVSQEIGDIVTYTLSAEGLRKEFPDGKVDVTAKIVSPRGYQIYQADGRMEVPEFHYIGPFNKEGIAEWNMGSVPSSDLWLYFMADKNASFELYVNDLVSSSSSSDQRQNYGDKSIDNARFGSRRFKAGNNFVRIENLKCGNVYQLIVVDTNQLSL